jgi:cytochrome c553
MKRRLLVAAWVGAAALSGAPLAQEAQKPDLAKAQQTVTQVCSTCHGADGNSATSVNPNLAGQHAEYITRQLRSFKSGLRKHDIMQAMAAPLSDADMASLGAWFSQQKPKPGAARDPDLLKLGQQIYRGGDVSRGLPACAGCHSPTGAGIPANFPRVAGQYADYTFAQLKAFHDGRRGVDPEGKDPNGRTMSEVATKLTEREMRAVAEYASGLQ